MNGVTSTALSVSREGLYTSITAGLCLERCGKVLVTVSPVLQRMAIRLSISSRIFLRFCWIFAESSLLAGCFVLGNKVFIAVATSNRIWETALLCMGELTSTGQTNRELYTGFVFTGLTGVQMAMMDLEIDKRMMMKVTVHEQSAHCLFFLY